MASTGATQAVGAGLATANVVAALASSYQVSLSTSWVTDYDITAKTAAGFTVNFAVPAPAGGGTFDWIAFGVGAGVGSVDPLQGATQALAVGLATAAVVGSFGASSYMVTVTTSWVTGYDVVAKTAAGFTVNFAVPAPAGGGTFDWIVWSPGSGTVALSDYLSDLRDLLRDPNDDIWTQAMKTRFLNKALQRRDEDTEGNRTLITKTLTAGTGTYSFTTLGNPRVFDVIGINLIFVAQRIVWEHVSFTAL